LAARALGRRAPHGTGVAKLLARDFIVARIPPAMRIPFLPHLLLVGLPLVSALVGEASEAPPAKPATQVAPAANQRDPNAAQKKNSSNGANAPTSRSPSSPPKYLFM
jgi:hypothetical protein